MSVIIPSASISGVTGITGTYESSWITTYNTASLRVSWKVDQNTTINVLQGSNQVDTLFTDTFTSLASTSNTQLIQVKSEYFKISATFASTPTSLTIETFRNNFFFSTLTNATSSSYGEIYSYSLGTSITGSYQQLNLSTSGLLLNTSSNGTGGIQISQSGTYLCQGYLNLTNVSEIINLSLAINGVTGSNRTTFLDAGANNDTIPISRLLSLNSNDIVSLMYQTDALDPITFNNGSLEVILQGGTQGPTGPTGPSLGLTLLSSVTSNGSTATIIFDNIPQNFKNLVIDIFARSTSTEDGKVDINTRYNNDESESYYWLQIANTEITDLGGTSARFTGINDTRGNTGATGSFSPANIIIYNYSNPNMSKVALGRGSAINNTSENKWLINTSSQWFSYDPITRIDLLLAYGNYANNSVITLYGSNV